MDAVFYSMRPTSGKQVDVIQGEFQRFAMFIHKLPVELQIKTIRLLVERITIFKDHITIKVLETPVEEIQKALDGKLVFGGCGSPERWGAKTNFQQKDHRSAVVELGKEWRGQRGQKLTFWGSPSFVKNIFCPPLNSLWTSSEPSAKRVKNSSRRSKKAFKPEKFESS